MSVLDYRNTESHKAGSFLLSACVDPYLIIFYGTLTCSAVFACES